MKVNTVSCTCALLIATCYISLGTDAMPSGGSVSRQTRQAPGNSLPEFPVKIAGGHNAISPSVGALSSLPLYGPYSVGNRQDAPAPPIQFGARPRPQYNQNSQYYGLQNYYNNYSPYYNWYSPYDNYY